MLKSSSHLNSKGNIMFFSYRSDYTFTPMARLTKNLVTYDVKMDTNVWSLSKQNGTFELLSILPHGNGIVIRDQVDFLQLFLKKYIFVKACRTTVILKVNICDYCSIILLI